MSFGPACERCGGNSYEGSTEPRPIRCPWCHRVKRRGSREELVAVVNAAKTTLLAMNSFLEQVPDTGIRALAQELITATVEAIDDV